MRSIANILQSLHNTIYYIINFLLTSKLIKSIKIKKPNKQLKGLEPRSFIKSLCKIKLS